MFIPDPDVCPSRIQKQQQKKNISFPTFFVTTKIIKIVNYINFGEEKNVSQL
jgi:hypothetical protein